MTIDGNASGMNAGKTNVAPKNPNIATNCILLGSMTVMMARTKARIIARKSAIKIMKNFLSGKDVLNFVFSIELLSCFFNIRHICEHS
jgi:hypothetical protein